jgi:hypothetical protein
MCRVGDGVTNEGDTEQDGSMAKSYSPDMRFATIDTSIAPIPRPCAGYAPVTAQHTHAPRFSVLPGNPVAPQRCTRDTKNRGALVAPRSRL